MERWALDEFYYERLLRYIGCGNFPKADIVFLGNEEGTGGYDIPSNIIARSDHFGKDENDCYKYFINSSDTNEMFYYEPSAQQAGRKVSKESYKRSGFRRTEEFASGSFLQTIARMCLALDQPSESPDYWFQKYNNDLNAQEGIKNFIRKNMFEPRTSGIQCALIDWRPLPRADMKQSGENWPDEYRRITEELYIKAFALNFKRPRIEQFANYQKGVEVRKKMIKNVLEQYEIPVLIGLGETNLKKNMFTSIYGDVFKPLYFETVNADRGYGASLRIENKIVHIFLIPHPNARSNIIGNIYSFYKEFTYKYLLPSYNGEKWPKEGLDLGNLKHQKSSASSE